MSTNNKVNLSQENILTVDLSGRNEKAPKASQIALLNKWAMYASTNDVSFVIDAFIKRAESRAEYAKKQQAAEAQLPVTN